MCPDLAPHKVKICLGGCLDDRFVNHHPDLINFMGGGFHTNMLGGAACVFDPELRNAFIAQFVDSYRIVQYKKIVLVVHYDCGWLGWKYQTVSQNAGFEVDPANTEHLLRIGEMAGRLIQDRLKTEHGADIPVNVIVPVVLREGDKTELRVLAERTFEPKSALTPLQYAE